MKRIFISYARSDQAFARKLTNKLESIGADVWIDLDDIMAGEKWSSAIQDGLDTSDGMVVVLSPDSMASNNVEDEWQYFMDYGNPVIPILLHPAKVHFQLNRLQYVDFHTQEFEPAFADLLEELRVKGVALDGGINTEQASPIKQPEQTSPVRTAEKAQATTLTKPLWQQTPIIIGAVIAVIGIIGFGIWFTMPNIEAKFDFIEEALTIEDDWEVHENANASSQLIPIGDSEILHRFVSNDDIWYQITDFETDFDGFQRAQDIPVDNSNVLNVIPMQITVVGETITLYNRPYTSDISIEADAFGVSYLYGIFIDIDDNIWYYVSVFEGEGDSGYTGWTRNDLLISDEYTLLPLIYSDRDVEVDGGTIREGDLLWLISRDIDSSLYEVAYYDRDDAEWNVVFLEDDDLEVNNNNRREIPYRGN